MWIEFPSLLPISTFLLFLSPSEHSTQYSAEIIFCWMRFGHKSRADLLRPLHSLFLGLLSTWQFKSLITLTRNPFPAAQAGPAGWAPPGTRAALRMVWAPADRTPSPGPRVPSASIDDPGTPHPALFHLLCFRRSLNGHQCCPCHPRLP